MKLLTPLLLFVLFVTSTTQTINAQKVTVKKGIFSVDKVPYIASDYDQFKSAPFLFTTLDGSKKLFAIQSYTYTCKERKSTGSGYIEVDGTCLYYKVKFLGSEREMYTKKYPKSFIELIYKYQLLNPSGEVDESKIDEFIKIYGEDERVIVTVH